MTDDNSMRDLSPEERYKLALAKIKKSLGPVVYSAEEGLHSHGWIHTGAYSLDCALGGGWAKGRIVEIFGKESACKSSLCLQAVRSIQKEGGSALYIDMEHALNKDHIAVFGISTKDLLISQPISGTVAIKILEGFATVGGVNLIIVDSVDALVTEEELNKSSTDSNVGNRAKLMSQALRRLTPLCNQFGMTIIFINQLRDDIGMFGPGTHKVTSGGHALKYYASQRVQVSRITPKSETKDFIGIKVDIVKNKVARPFLKANLNYNFKTGFDTIEDLYEYGKLEGVLTMRGPYLYFDDTQLCRGREEFVMLMETSPQILVEIKKKLGLEKKK